MVEKMKSYAVWIIVLTPLAQSQIATALVNSKIHVSALSDSGSMVSGSPSDNWSAYTIALHLQSLEEKASDFRNKIRDIFKENGIKYLSLIVHAGSGAGSAWQGSTYKYETPEPVVNSGPYRTNAKGTN